MTVWMVTRHPGALVWAEREGVRFDQHVPHLDVSLIQPGDRVIGSLPVNLAAEVCQRGAEYYHLSLELPPGLRGIELDARQLDACGAHIQRYNISKC